MIDGPLLRKVMEHIEANQGRWLQGAWNTTIVDADTDFGELNTRSRSHLEAVYDRKLECGAAFCFAGWAAELDGQKFIEYGVLEDGLPIMDWAQERLGLDAQQADELFHGGNKLETLQAMVAKLCAKADRQLAGN